MNLLNVAIRTEQDVVAARQRARQVAELAGLDHQDQIRVATAVSELARNAFQYAGGGRVTFSLGAGPPSLEVAVSDSGPGIRNLDAVLGGSYQSPTGLGLGVVGARRLMDTFHVESSPSGTVIRIGKYLPAGVRVEGPDYAARIARQLAAAAPAGALDELHLQNHELIRALEELRQRETELRQLNQELEDTNRGVMALYAELDDRADSLRRADQVKSRFLSHMSHEFRTPLNSILALTRLLQSGADGPLSPEQNKQIGYVRRAAEELAETVNDLLDLAKVESGKTTIHVSEFSAASAFGALRGLLRPLQTGEVALIFEDPDPRLALRTDEGKVGQVLRNLVSNALKFTEKGEVRVRVEADTAGVTFQVIDTGIGIAPAEQERIFQEFAQVENALQGRHRGTGLGLPLSRKLAELLGGRLTVQSTPGAGSTFQFWLPADVIIHPRGERSPDETSDDTLETLLVIDDDEVSRYLVRQIFRNTSLEVTEAQDGVAGLEKARFDRPNLIMLDLNMPGPSGFEILEQLSQQPETSSIPVLIYTSLSLSSADKDRLRRHAAAILSKKDLAEQDLVSMVTKITGLSLRV